MTDALLRASVHGAVFAAAVWLACRLLPKMPAWLRCSLWWLACLKVLVSLASPIDLPLLPAEPATVTTMVWSGPAALAAPGVPAAAPRLSWPAVLVAVWLAGFALHLVWTGRQLLSAGRLVRQSEPVGDAGIAQEFEELRRRLGIGRPVALRASADVQAPQVLGLFRPTVLLPASRSLTPSDLSMALCHELIHIRRADLWWGWVPAAAQRLFWFHPLVRLAAREYALAREAACDAEVLRVLDPEPQAYGRLLLRLGIAPRAACTAAAGAAPSVQTLKRRLQMLEQTSSKRRQPLLWAGLIVVVALVALVPFRIVAQAADAPEVPPAPPAPAALPAAAPAPAPPAQPALPAAAPAVAPAARVAKTPPAPPVPPVPPAPPAPPAAWSGSKDESFILFTGKHRTMMNGSMSDVRKAKDLQKGDEPLLYFRRGGKSYLVRDGSLLKEAESLFLPQAELGVKLGELGAQQGLLGAKQGELGAKQGALGARQGALAAKQARASFDDEDTTELESQMEELGREMEELGRQMEALGEKMEVLGRQQEQLGREQERLGREAEKKLRVLVDEALQKGLAQEVK